MLASMLLSSELVLTVLAHAAWQAGLLALVIVGLTRCLGDHLQPRWRFGLWLIVFARLALPVLPEASWSIFQIVSSIRAPQPQLLHDTVTVNSTPIIDDYMQEHLDHATINEKNEPPSPKVGAFRLIDLAFLIWAAGVVVLMVRHTVNFVQLLREQRRWQKITDTDVLSVLRDCCQELRCNQSVSLFRSLENIGPATCGVVRPQVVIPQKLLNCLTTKELRLVLLHEIVHVRRCDAIVDQLIGFVTILHWFHPVAWFSRYSLRCERELACDAAVLEDSPADDANEYGQALIKTIESLAMPTVPLPGLVGMLSRKPLSIVHRRIRLIATYRQSNWTAFLFGVGILFGLVLVGLTDAQSELPKSKISDKPEILTERNRSEVKKAPVQEQSKAVSAGVNVDSHVKHHRLDVKGRALDQNGHPIAGATIYIASTDASPRKLIGSTQTDQDGLYKFSDAQLPYLPKESDERYDQGMFEVFGKSAGLGFGWSGMQYLLIDPRFVGPDGRPTVVDPSNVHLPDERIDINLTFLPARWIRGRFLDDQGRGIQNVKVIMTDCNYAEDLMGPDPAPTYEETLKKTHREFRSIQTARGAMPDQLSCLSDADGWFEFKSVPEGIVCQLSAEHPDYGSWWINTGNAEKLPKKYKFRETQPMPIEMKRQKARSISVRLRYRDTLEPIVGATVGAYVELGFYNAVRSTDELGNAILKLPPGEYTVMAFPPKDKEVLNAKCKLVVNATDEEQVIDLVLNPK